MVDVAANLEPIPTGDTADIAAAIDSFVATRVYEILGFKTDYVTVDITPPVVSGFVPSAGTQLAPTDSVEFDVTDDSGTFARNMIAVAFADGTQELVYDGQAFTARYLAGSTVTAISGQAIGFHYLLRRTGGWLGSTITIRAFSVDSSGNTES